MIEIQTSLLDLINYSIKELKRLNPSVCITLLTILALFDQLFSLAFNYFLFLA